MLSSISEEIGSLNAQFLSHRRRGQRAEADKILIQILCTSTAQLPGTIFDSLKRLQHIYATCSHDFDEEVENCAWEAFVLMRERLPDSPLVLNLICLYTDFLGELAYRGRTFNKERLTIIADFLSDRGDRFLLSLLSAFVDKLDRTIQLNIDTAEILGEITTLLMMNSSSHRVRCWTLSKILGLYSYNFPIQVKVSEKLLKLTLLESIPDQISHNLRWCARALHDGVIERNYESAEVIEVWLASAISLEGSSTVIEVSRPASLREYYKSD